MAKARKPSTPGEILLKEYLEPAGIAQADFAKHIGLATSTLSRLIDGKTKLTIRTAYRLAKATKTTVEFWVNLQQAIDLAEAKAGQEYLSRLGYYSKFEHLVKELCHREILASEAQALQALHQHIETLGLSLSKAVDDFLESKS